MKQEEKAFIGRSDRPEKPVEPVRRVFRTTWNNKYFPKEYPKVSDISETIPDQAMSVQEILKRFASGREEFTGRVPVWMAPDAEEDDLSSIDMSMLDYADRQKIILDYRAELKETEDRIARAKRRAAEEARERGLAKQKDDEQGTSSERTWAPQQGDAQDDAQPPYPKKTPPEGPRRAAGGDTRRGQH